jgi:hypothetical protein
MADIKPPKGYIVREGYKRKAYVRSSYTRSDGTKVKATKVSAAKVPPTLIKDRGAPGKGPKLIPLKNDPRHMDGYHFNQSEADRHAAIRKAVNKYGATWAIRHLNAVRNLQHRTNPANAAKAVQDMAYIRSLKK